MTTTELQELQAKIDRAKSDQAKAEGTIEQIKKQWKDEYGLNTEEEVEQQIKTYNQELQTLEDEKRTLEKELESFLE